MSGEVRTVSASSAAFQRHGFASDYQLVDRDVAVLVRSERRDNPPLTCTTHPLPGKTSCEVQFRFLLLSLYGARF